MKKNLWIIIVIAFVLCFFLYLRNPRSIRITDNGNNIPNLSASALIYLDEMGIGNITCTGLTYDTVNNSFWIGDYGALDFSTIPKPRLIELSADFKTVLSEISLNGLEKESNLQGIAYSQTRDSLWAAAGNNLYEINKKGGVIKIIDLQEYAKYKSNGICIDDNDNIWVLCYSKYLLKFNDDGVFIKKYDMNYLDQDHISWYNGYLYMSVGADYTGNENYICRVDSLNGTATAAYQLDDAFAIEGICVLNGRLFVVNDGFYHQARINRSYVSIYDFPGGI